MATTSNDARYNSFGCRHDLECLNIIITDGAQNDDTEYDLMILLYRSIARAPFHSCRNDSSTVQHMCPFWHVSFLARVLSGLFWPFSSQGEFT